MTSKQSGNEPGLSQDYSTADSPELGGDKRQVLCKAHNVAMIRDLFGQHVCVECIATSRASSAHPKVTRGRLLDDPLWFNPAKTTPAIHIQNVRRGLHPMGAPIGTVPGATCGNCEHHYENSLAKTYHKCDLIKHTGGPATDIRLNWPGCVSWQPKEEISNDSE